MRGTVAKQLRRKHMGESYSVRFRKYSTGPNGERIDLGPRGRYLKAKKKYKRRNKNAKS